MVKVERHEKWTAVEGVTTPVARALIEEGHDGLVITLVFSDIVDGLNSDLCIDFGRVPAYAVYEEFVHPWIESNGEAPPKLEGKWKDFSYPLLLVRDSDWQSSFSDSQLVNWSGCVHYRLVTLDQTVDVLCNRAPLLSWIEVLTEA
jgi:hypothetical protein